MPTNSDIFYSYGTENIIAYGTNNDPFITTINYGMFYNCSNLKYVYGNILISDSFFEWQFLNRDIESPLFNKEKDTIIATFGNCNKLIEFNGLTNICIPFMFYNCTSLIKAPEFIKEGNIFINGT